MPQVKIPGYDQPVDFPDSMSSDEISKAAARLYQEKSGGFQKPKGEVSKKAEKHLKSIDTEQKIAGVDMAQGENMNKAAQAGAMLPFALAAPFTSGGSIAFGLSLMGAAGATSAVVGEAGRAGSTKARSGSDASTNKDLAISIGSEAALGAIMEGTGRAVMHGVEKGIGYVGKTLFPKILERSAAGNAAGRELLKKAFENTRKALYGSVEGMPKLNIGQYLRDAYADLREIPVGAGSVGREFSSLGPRAEEVVGKMSESFRAEARSAQIGKQLRATQREFGGAKPDPVTQQMVAKLESELEVVNGQISSHQSLAPMVRMQGNIQQLAYDGLRTGALNTEEAQVFKRLAANLDEHLRGALKGNEQATELYNHSKQLMKTQFEHDTGAAITADAIKNAVAKSGRLSRIANYGLDKVSNWALQRAFEADPTLMRKAIDQGMKGNKLGAGKIVSQILTNKGITKMLEEAAP